MYLFNTENQLKPLPLTITTAESEMPLPMKFCGIQVYVPVSDNATDGNVRLFEVLFCNGGSVGSPSFRQT